ncbi:MAG: CcmD family protein [Bacteroidota bacterium]
MEQFLHDNQLYIVLILVLTIWFGFLFYMFRLDAKIKKLEESLRK